MGCLLQSNSFLIGYQLRPDRPICFGKDEESEAAVSEKGNNRSHIKDDDRQTAEKPKGGQEQISPACCGQNKIANEAFF